jgi:hypothetical protein
MCELFAMSSKVKPMFPCHCINLACMTVKQHIIVIAGVWPSYQNKNATVFYSVHGTLKKY